MDNLYDWLLFFHVLSAFLIFAAVVMYSAFVLGAPVSRGARLVAEIVWGVGGLGTLVLGVWLAIHIDAYSVWDGWILGAIVLWVAATGIGTQVSRAVQPDGSNSPIAVDSQVALLHWTRTILVVVLLVVMVWKPGA